MRQMKVCIEVHFTFSKQFTLLEEDKQLKLHDQHQN